MLSAVAEFDRMCGLRLEHDLAACKVLTMRLHGAQGWIVAAPEDAHALEYCQWMLLAGIDGLLFTATDGAQGRQNNRAFLDRIQDFGKSEGVLPARVLEMMRETIRTLQAGGKVPEPDFLLVIRFLNFLTYGDDQPPDVRRLGQPE